MPVGPKVARTGKEATVRDPLTGKQAGTYILSIPPSLLLSHPAVRLPSCRLRFSLLSLRLSRSLFLLHLTHILDLRVWRVEENVLEAEREENRNILLTSLYPVYLTFCYF
jgi:hypothetical protein